MIEITGGKLPNSNLTMYQIFSNRGGKFWGCEVLEFIGSIVNGVFKFEKHTTTEERKEAEREGQFKLIVDKF